ncbi:hypothetical protein E2C01_079877 [Portunus trituberculatus]|uniref:Uncharacterized protein n=1 Tax=Portunus trituberculatus TaxID=210409 RepID=A0A5B7IWT2_PORTR|nr:hypothetical protein [Portunus trituberculatus]
MFTLCTVVVYYSATHASHGLSPSNTAWRDSRFTGIPFCLCLTGCPVLQCCDPLLWSLHSQSTSTPSDSSCLDLILHHGRSPPATKPHPGRRLLKSHHARYLLPSLQAFSKPCISQ